MLGRNPGMTPNQVKYALVRSARDAARRLGPDGGRRRRWWTPATAALSPPAGSANAGVVRSNGTRLAARSAAVTSRCRRSPPRPPVINGLLTAQLLLWDPTGFLLGWNPTELVRVHLGADPAVRGHLERRRLARPQLGRSQLGRRRLGGVVLRRDGVRTRPTGCPSAARSGTGRGDRQAHDGASPGSPRVLGVPAWIVLLACTGLGAGAAADLARPGAVRSPPSSGSSCSSRSWSPAPSPSRSVTGARSSRSTSSRWRSRPRSC